MITTEKPYVMPYFNSEWLELMIPDRSYVELVSTKLTMTADDLFFGKGNFFRTKKRAKAIQLCTEFFNGIGYAKDAIPLAISQATVEAYGYMDGDAVHRIAHVEGGIEGLMVVSPLPGSDDYEDASFEIISTLEMEVGYLDKEWYV